MSNQSQKTAKQNWLHKITAESMKTMAFPLQEVLTDSLYYPASWFHGEPVALLFSRRIPIPRTIQSVIFVDYGHTKDELMDALNERGFAGYKQIGIRDITENELAPHGWTPTVIPQWMRTGRGPTSFYQKFIKSPFAVWIVFEREAGYTDEHGPERFSFLYLCADGVAAYQALYHKNKKKPIVLVLIKGGWGFGGNWTDFRKEQEIMHETVMHDPDCIPEYVLQDGGDTPDNNHGAYWSEYTELVGEGGDYRLRLLRYSEE